MDRLYVTVSRNRHTDIFRSSFLVENWFKEVFVALISILFSTSFPNLHQYVTHRMRSCLDIIDVHVYIFGRLVLMLKIAFYF